MDESEAINHEQADPQEGSPHWGRSTKIVIIVAILLISALAAWRFQGLIVMTVTAGVIAFILNPLVAYVNQRTRIARGWVILLIYVIFAVAVIIRYLWAIVGIVRGEAPDDVDITKASSGL